ncbi:MAG: transposase [Bacillota bacterium]
MLGLLQTYYHERVHSASKQKPVVCFEHDPTPLRRLDLAQLHDALLLEDNRSVDKTRVFTLFQQPYQAPLEVAGWVLDDTVVRKTGQKMAGLGWHYSHADQQQVWGHCFVTALYVIAGYGYPVGVLLYQSQRACSQSGSKFRSKLALAAQLIAEFTPVPGTRTVVLFDSWYASSTLIQVALDRRFEVVYAVKNNRVLRECAHTNPVPPRTRRGTWSEEYLQVPRTESRTLLSVH